MQNWKSYLFKKLFQTYTKQLRSVQKEIDFLNLPKEEGKLKDLIASLELEISEFKEALEIVKNKYYDYLS